MTMQDTIIKADGTVTFTSPANPRKGYDLTALQGIVGGYIEIVRTRIPGVILVINEEGLLMDLPLNLAATQYAGQPIVGDVLLCSDNHVK